MSLELLFLNLSLYFSLEFTACLCIICICPYIFHIPQNHLFSIKQKSAVINQFSQRFSLVDALEPGIDLLEALNLRSNITRYTGIKATPGTKMTKRAYHLMSK